MFYRGLRLFTKKLARTKTRAEWESNTIFNSQSARMNTLPRTPSLDRSVASHSFVLSCSVSALERPRKERPKNKISTHVVRRTKISTHGHESIQLMKYQFLGGGT